LHPVIGPGLVNPVSGMQLIGHRTGRLTDFRVTEPIEVTFSREVMKAIRIRSLVILDNVEDIEHSLQIACCDLSSDDFLRFRVIITYSSRSYTTTLKFLALIVSLVLLIMISIAVILRSLFL
jgi:hypothetical protein